MVQPLFGGSEEISLEDVVLSNVLRQFEDIHLLGKHGAIFVAVFGRNEMTAEGVSCFVS